MQKYLLVLLTTLLLIGCGVKTDCTTAQDFIKSYSQAYRNGDANAIMKMRAGIGLLEKMDIDPVLKEELRNYNLEQERKELEEGLKQDGMWIRAWKNTVYAGEKDHGDHIHVNVTVDGIPSAVVLVRDGEFLRIHPRPSWFD
jgi:RNA binding exosome subunit